MSIRHGNLILERGARTTINVDRRGNLSVVLPISLPPGFEIEESTSKPQQPQIYESKSFETVFMKLLDFRTYLLSSPEEAEEGVHTSQKSGTDL